MNSQVFFDKLLSKPFKFWVCSNNSHGRVSWNEKGDQATCDECGEKSPVFEKKESMKNSSGYELKPKN